MSWTRAQLLASTTRSPWTRDFRHLNPVPKKFLVRNSFYDPAIKAVPVQDRIKYWNIVPGDHIRIRGDTRSIVHEVLSVNKLTNRVYLKGAVTESRGKAPVNRNIHYSRCQLLIGETEAEQPDGDSSTIQKLFARRIETRNVRWQPVGHKWEWDRVAIALAPRKQDQKPVKIEWPKQDPLPKPQTDPMLDTSESVVKAITYQPPAFDASTIDPTARAKAEKEYLKKLFQRDAPAYDESRPMEIYVSKELCNPHGRAKMQARWQAAQARKSALLQKLIREHTAKTSGVSASQAKMEALFKYRQIMDEERKAEKKRRWMTPARLAKMAKKTGRRQRKAEKQAGKLDNLVLHNDRNQVAPRV
ncbi:hypothetical protein CONPUDRAFT_165097 [Coniophora puteana RWD-64-598 SS2]|uniref:KOW domain-containing protein n=1 Tax=Coniophora puteana (strain RWD-64-598) TaxID=741705 RepID=A0A5M3MUT3_CONPW|nr:uncharacterized protein CONPUDRAFT_165097 [Coniophora puteana RWD-64-598 SS2]EIW82514.1 hypothetical protein CONPUDRAFT_165097 [Coniophora puteana RWD-64-598 SS2]